MWTIKEVGSVVAALAVGAAFAGCAAPGASSPAPAGLRTVIPAAVLGSSVHSVDGVPSGERAVSSGAGRYQSASAIGQSEALFYLSDAALGAVDAFDQSTGKQVGTIAGFSEPQGLYVDAARNLWVANTTGAGSSGGNVLEFALGGTSPIATLSDTGNYPVDVAVCPNGTAYVSNIFNLQTGIGNIAVYANGATSPTGTLQFPGQSTNYFITCDAAGNVFTSLNLRRGPGVVEYPGGQQAGARALPIKLQFPGGIKANSRGQLAVDDQNAHTICTYTESGGKPISCISTGSTDVVDFALNGTSSTLWTSNVVKYAYPSGKVLRRYRIGKSGQYVGIALSPGD